MLTTTLKHLFPDSDLLTDIQVTQTGDGPQITLWNRPEPQPTQAEIEAAYPAALLAAQRAAIPSATPRQIRQALTASGLRAAVEGAVAASDQDTKDWWEFAQRARRAARLPR